MENKMSENNQIGKPVYGGNKKKYFKIKEGSNVYRLLPPFGTLAKEGKWAVYERVHWGYKGSNGSRQFVCIQVKDVKTKMIKQACPECNKIADILSTYETKFKLLTETKGQSEAEAKEFLKPLSDWLFTHNCNKKWFVNAINTQGEIGRLEMPHKMFTALQNKIGELLKRKIDPIAVDGGVYFDLQRTGTKGQTTHAVEIVTEEVDVDGEKLQKVKKAPLTQETIEKFKIEAHDLGGMFRQLTYNEIKRLVDSGGDTKVVDEVFASPVTAEVPEVDEDEPAETVAVVSTPAPKEDLPPQKAVPAETVKMEESTEVLREELEAQLKVLEEETKAELSKVSKPTNGTPKVKTESKTLSNEEFLKTFGISK